MRSHTSASCLLAWRLILFVALGWIVQSTLPEEEDPSTPLVDLNKHQDRPMHNKKRRQRNTSTPPSSSLALLQQVHVAWTEFWLKNLVVPLRKLPSRGERRRPGLPSETGFYDSSSSPNDFNDLLPIILSTQRRARSISPAWDEDVSNHRNDDACKALEILNDDDNDDDDKSLICQEEESPLPRDDWSSDIQVTYDPHIGMVLEVYNMQQGRICKANDQEQELRYDHDDEWPIEVTYQLQEPLDLELGTTVKHAADFAYAPVITAGTESVVVNGDAFDSPDLYGNEEEESLEGRPHVESWWQWWIPWWKWDGSQDHSQQYRMHSSFAGGSHGEVWRGRRKCRGHTHASSFTASSSSSWCKESLILKRLKIENGYRVLEAGLREIYFGTMLATEQTEELFLFTEYQDHFFRERHDQEPELWIVFRDAGASLRSFLYSGTNLGDFIIYQHSRLWAQLRQSVSQKRNNHEKERDEDEDEEGTKSSTNPEDSSPVGRDLFRRVLRQILEAAAFLHQKGIVHRDIKPSNIMCQSSLDSSDDVTSSLDTSVRCVLGDFSSAWDKFTDENLYTGRPSRAEQTDEYAPPESFFDAESPWLLSPAFDSWSIGIVTLELLLGTPNVFTVDQRTKAILTHKLKHRGASEEEIEKALYLAALSQFCIYNPQHVNNFDWPLRVGDPLYNSAMVKEKCTLHDFHRALRARDPLGLGFSEESDQLLLLVWQLLAWDPSKRISPKQALRHTYFLEGDEETIMGSADTKALESLMLDPRRDFNLTDVVHEFTCPRCGRVFGDWMSCRTHALARKHAKFCDYDHSSLPTCLNAHSMLPAHVASGHCDIQGRRRVIEDMHAVQLTPTEHFYGIFDGHSGNRASKYAASFLFPAMKERLGLFVSPDSDSVSSTWSEDITSQVQSAFHEVHDKFLDAIAVIPQSRHDQSGTTATVAFVTKEYVVLASLGDSRAVLSTQKGGSIGAIQLTRDHVASDPVERAAIERRGGRVVRITGIDRVNGTLAVSRSLGDARLSGILSQTPDVMPFKRESVLEMCGELKHNAGLPCFLVLASDGLWDVLSNEEAVDLVLYTLQSRIAKGNDDSAALQKAAEALVQEAFVRGSSDNIGVCVISLSESFDGSYES